MPRSPHCVRFGHQRRWPPRTLETIVVNWKQDLALSIVLLGLAIAFYVTGLDYPDTTAMFPSKLAPILGVLAILQGISALRHQVPGKQLVNWAASRGPILVVLLMSGFILILPQLGYLVSCALFALSVFVSLGYPNKKKAVLVAVAASVIIYLIFHTALGVSLPVGELWSGE